MDPTNHRPTYSAFLERLAIDQETVEEWLALAVTHYHDPDFEDARRRCVRLALNATRWGDWSATQREGFLSLAYEFRRHATD
jgi:hypothetical protein